MSEEQQVDYIKFLNEISVELSDPATNYHITLKGFTGIFDFFQKEYEFWEQIENRVGYK